MQIFQKLKFVSTKKKYILIKVIKIIYSFLQIILLMGYFTSLQFLFYWYVDVENNLYVENSVGSAFAQ